MMTLAFFLEGQSEKALLEKLLSRMLTESQIQVRYVVFEGKQDLQKQLVGKLRGWRTPSTYFVVLRDQDAAECLTVKQELTALCKEANCPDVLVRVACREVESWYLGDLAAVGTALGIGNLHSLQNKEKFRSPDTLHHPAKELGKLTSCKYEKISGSKAIGTHLDLSEANRSKSFHVFLSGVRSLVEKAVQNSQMAATSF